MGRRPGARIGKKALADSMKRRLVTILCVLAASSALAGGVGGEPVRVVLVGDSITVGKMSEPQGPSYVERLRELLGDGYAIANVGVGGSGSEDWRRPLLLKRIESNTPAEIASVLLGTNDAVGFRKPKPTPPEQYARAILALVDDLVVLGAERVILMTPPPHHWPDVDGRLLDYRERLLSLCWARESLVCGPDLYQLLDGKTDFEHEKLHPNANGHRKIAEALARAILAISPSERGARPSTPRAGAGGDE